MTLVAGRVGEVEAHDRAPLRQRLAHDATVHVGRLHAAYGRTLARLAEVKRQWDPGNVFRLNRNITPAA